MRLDDLTKQAIRHTLHCLLGCSVGEILGMVLATVWNWSNWASIILSIGLAFFFGYLLTTVSLYRNQITGSEAVKTAISTDTTSIISMEAVDNIFILMVPGAISATLGSALFWCSLLASLVVAFVVTVPVNRYIIARHDGMHHH